LGLSGVLDAPEVRPKSRFCREGVILNPDFSALRVSS
jgi:hypothetical protein